MPCRNALRAQFQCAEHGTYGYDVITQIGWERQKGREHFEVIQAQLAPRVDIRLRRAQSSRESHVRYLYHRRYLPLLACQERTHLDELKQVGASTGLLLSLDGLMPVGGEPQLWVVRELQTGRTLRSGWLLRQDETAFVEFLQPIADLGLPVTALVSDTPKAKWRWRRPSPVSFLIPCMAFVNCTIFRMPPRPWPMRMKR